MDKIKNYLKLGPFALCMATNSVLAQKPNVLFVISDDQSYPYASAYGSKMVSTPESKYVVPTECAMISL